MIPEQVREWLRNQGHGEVTSIHTVGGGCISNGARLRTTAGQTFFLKSNPSSPPDMFAREWDGLQALAEPGGPRVPQPHLYGSDYLLLEDLQPAPRCSDYWPRFGRQLAALHNSTSPQFGSDKDNYIGSTPQPNTRQEDGYIFFAEHRLRFQGSLASRRGLLGTGELDHLERICQRLRNLVPEQPASLIHGDLWSGNAITDQSGAPAIIDPAAHHGWGEAELAMTALFGGFPDVFYQAYQEVRPLEKGFRERFPIYNLYHLLNHLNLFGSGYWGEVVGILRRYG